jgi:hypothetical protein
MIISFHSPHLIPTNSELRKFSILMFNTAKSALLTKNVFLDYFSNFV